MYLANRDFADADDDVGWFERKRLDRAVIRNGGAAGQRIARRMPVLNILGDKNQRLCGGAARPGKLR